MGAAADVAVSHFPNIKSASWLGDSNSSLSFLSLAFTLYIFFIAHPFPSVSPASAAAAAAACSFGLPWSPGLILPGLSFPYTGIP
ncbi:hypothetical protein F5X96DRAFT_661448 [Biscogniauxia mediterranea]|nr:hypothetical protein F5X96DRAFT_661448 [Biscogniauxia mediterranea]